MSGTKKFILIFASAVLIIAFLILIGVFFIHFYIKRNVDFTVDEALFASSRGGSTRFFAYDKGKVVELDSVSRSGIKKFRYTLDEISPYLKDGFIAVEDREFYNHNGVNYRRTAGALFNYVFRIAPVFGASTITQQVVKNISGDAELTASRKLSEMIRATHMEGEHTKEEILETYLNIVPMSDNMAGVGIAAKTYFGKEPSEVTVAEAATIIGITNAPARYNPYKNPDACIEKRNNVLFAMHDFGVISDDEYEHALSTPLALKSKRASNLNADSWFTETVIADLTDDLVSEYGMSRGAASLLISGGGLTVYTTQDTTVQGTLEEYFNDIGNFPSAVESGLNYSMVITDSKTGDLLGIVGSVGEKNADRILNYATAPVTPGSVLKPLALYAPLINEKRINYATVFDDTPVSFGDGAEYPHNSPNVYDGLTTVKTAIEKSKNTVAVKLYSMLGGERIYKDLKENFGFDTLVRNIYRKDGAKITDIGAAPLALGQLSYGVSLRKLTEAYTVFPSEGVMHNCRSYTEVYDMDGKLLLKNEAKETRVFRPQCARIMNQLLTGVTDSGTARAITLKNMVDTAGKTGTSGGDKDRLFIGYTPYLTAGIWCGYKEGGASVGNHTPSHLKIWDTVMKRLHEDILKNQEATEGFSTESLRYLPYCRDSGRNICDKCLYDPRGERCEYGYFEDGNIPTGSCDRHVLVLYDTLTDGVATEGCESDYLSNVSLLYIPERAFPKEIIITDAQYTWRDIGDAPRGESYDVPFFIYALPPNVYVGRSDGDKQFNSSCYIHDE